MMRKTESNHGKPEPLPRFVFRNGGLWGGNLYLFPALPSTNSWMLDHAGELGHGDVVYALIQTAGRGRNRRSWRSPAHGGIALSVLLGIPVPLSLYPASGMIAAVAVHRSLRQLGVLAHLKWPNDVLIRGKKVCGILCEARSARHLLITGVGINHRIAESMIAGDSLLERATSLHLHSPAPVSRGKLVRSLLESIRGSWETVLTAGFEPARRYWDRFDALTGARIRIRTGDRERCGVYLGMDENARLRMRTGDRVSVFWSGDVEQVRRTDTEEAGVNEIP